MTTLYKAIPSQDPAFGDPPIPILCLTAEDARRAAGDDGTVAIVTTAYSCSEHSCTDYMLAHPRMQASHLGHWHD